MENFTQQQIDELKRLKAYFPYRIIWGAINPQDHEFRTGADHTKRKALGLAKKGWIVCIAA